MLLHSPRPRGYRRQVAARRQCAQRAAARTAIFLLGDPAYYTRFGFSLEAAEPFETAYPQAFFIALALKPDALAGIPKKVEYPAAFRELG